MPVKPSSRWKEVGTGRQEKARKAVLAARKELEKAGEEVIRFVADPVLHGFTNQSLSDFLIEAAKDGWHMYPFTTTWGNRLKNAIANFERKERNIYCSPEDMILTPGVAAALNVVHYTLLDAGDEILAFDPSHYLGEPTSYWSYLGAKVVPCRALEESGWEPDLEELRAGISGKTKAIFVNNPHNPTGAVYDEKVQKSIVDIAGENDLPIISDEIYGMITFDGIKAKSMAEIAGDVPVIMMNGMSKFFMRTGWRLGYICFHDPQGKIKEVVDTAKKVSEAYGHLSQAIPTPILVAATKAYELYQGPLNAGRQMVRQLQINRDFIWKRLNEIKGVYCTKPRGTIFVFPRVSAIGNTWKSDEDFVIELMKEEKIMFDAGSRYGKFGFGHFRTVLLPKLEILEDVYDKLEKFIIRHSKSI